MTKVKGDGSFSRNLKTRSLSLSGNSVVVSASTLALNSFSPSVISFTGSTAGQIVSLGDATTYPQIGLLFNFINDSTQPLTIKDNGGTTLFTLQPNYSVLTYLESAASANGVWRFSLFVDRTLTALSESSRGGIICGFDGSASSGRWLEFYSNNPSNNSPLIIPEPSRLRALTITTSAASATATATIYKNGIAIETISLAGTKSARKKNLTHGLTDLDELSVQITSGSLSRPMVTLFIQTL